MLSQYGIYPFFDIIGPIPSLFKTVLIAMFVFPFYVMFSAHFPSKGIHFFLFHLIIFCHLCLSYLHYGTTSLYLQFPMYQPFISSDQYPIAQTIKITNYIFFLLLYDIYSGYFERDIVMRKECVVSCLR